MTKDMVFLLSYSEAWKYFKTDSLRQCVPTEYAIKQGALTKYNKDGSLMCCYWLRTRADDTYLVNIVNYDGTRSAVRMNMEHRVVRPALWIDLDSGLF